MSATTKLGVFGVLGNVVIRSSQLQHYACATCCAVNVNITCVAHVRSVMYLTFRRFSSCFSFSLVVCLQIHAARDNKQRQSEKDKT
jgi:hypothetical protein